MKSFKKLILLSGVLLSLSSIANAAPGLDDDLKVDVQNMNIYKSSLLGKLDIKIRVNNTEPNHADVINLRNRSSLSFMSEECVVNLNDIESNSIINRMKLSNEKDKINLLHFINRHEVSHCIFSNKVGFNHSLFDENMNKSISEKYLFNGPNNPLYTLTGENFADVNSLLNVIVKLDKVESVKLLDNVIKLRMDKQDDVESIGKKINSSESHIENLYGYLQLNNHDTVESLLLLKKNFDIIYVKNKDLDEKSRYDLALKIMSVGVGNTLSKLSVNSDVLKETLLNGTETFLRNEILSLNGANLSYNNRLISKEINNVLKEYMNEKGIDDYHDIFKIKKNGSFYVVEDNQSYKDFKSYLVEKNEVFNYIEKKSKEALLVSKDIVINFENYSPVIDNNLDFLPKPMLNFNNIKNVTINKNNNMNINI